MTKVLKNLLITLAFVVIGVGSYGIARAYFSSIEPAHSTATFQAGTITIDIAQHNGYNTVPFSMTNWMPGQTQDVVFDVVNSSTVPVTLSGLVNGTWGDALGDHYVSVIGADYWDGSGWSALNADTHGTFNYADYGSSVLKEVPGNGGVVTFRMTAKFDENAGNEYQGQTYTADLYVTATQVMPS